MVNGVERGMNYSCQGDNDANLVVPSEVNRMTVHPSYCKLDRGLNVC